MSMDWTARELVEALREKPKPEAYDTQATVTRVDGDTLWVHIPGGVDETPVRRTINASEGDTIQVRISGGSATATGNATAPPTDDKRANEAAQMAQETAETMAQVVETVQKAGASLLVMGNQIRSVVTELDEKNRTYSAGAGTAYAQLCTKDGDPICTKAGAPIMAAVRIPSGTALDDYTVGDLWYDTDEDNAVYRWNGTYWEPVADQRISEISQKLDSITLRVVGEDGAVSEIKMTDQGDINLLGSVLADRIALDELLARDVTVTGQFLVDTPLWAVRASGTGIRLGAQKEGDDLGSYLDIQYAVQILAGQDMSLSASRGGITLFAPLGGIIIDGELRPEYNNEFTLGSSSYKWSNVYTNKINGNPPVTRLTKTITGSTSTSGNLNLGLSNDDYGVISVQRTDAVSICQPYINASGAWLAHLTTSAASPAVVASTSVTLQVDYFER